MGVWVGGKGWRHSEKISPLKGTNWKMCALKGGEGQEVLQGPAWVRVGPGQKAATSQATDAQCRRM